MLRTRNQADEDEMMTIVETRELCRGGAVQKDGLTEYDPLFNAHNEAAEAKVVETPEGLLLLGSHGDEECCDLLIRPIENGWLCFNRDCEDSDGCYGREWISAGPFEDWEDVVSWAYCL